MADASSAGRGKKKGGLAKLLSKKRSKVKTASLDDLHASSSLLPSDAAGAPSSEVTIVARSVSAPEATGGADGLLGADDETSGAMTTSQSDIVGVVAARGSTGTLHTDIGDMDAGRSIRSAVRKHQTRLASGEAAEASAPAGPRRYVAGSSRSAGARPPIVSLSEAMGGSKAPARSGSGAATNAWTQLAMQHDDADALDSEAGPAIQVPGGGMPPVELTSALCTGPPLTEEELDKAARDIAEDLRGDLKPEVRADETVALKPLQGPEYRVRAAVRVLLEMGDWGGPCRAAVGPFILACLEKRAFSPSALSAALAAEVYPQLPDMVCDAPRLYEYVASALAPLAERGALDTSSASSADVRCMPDRLRKAMGVDDAAFAAKAAAAEAERAAAEAKAEEARTAAAKAAEEAKAAAAEEARAAAEAAAAEEARRAKVFVPSAARRSAGEAVAPLARPAAAPVAAAVAGPAAGETGDAVAALLAASSGKKKGKKGKKKAAAPAAGPEVDDDPEPALVAAPAASDADVSALLSASAGGKKKKKAKKAKAAE